MDETYDDPLKDSQGDGAAAAKGARASGEGQNQGPGEGDANSGSKGTDPEEVEVEWGGAKRRMKVSELVEMARSREEAEESARVARGMLRQNEQLNMLQEFIEGLDPADQATLRRFMSDPAAFRSQGQRPNQDEPTSNGRDAARDEGASKVLSQLGQAVQFLLEREQAREQANERQSLEQKVSASMSGFEVFKGNGPSRDYAFQAIMNELALNPNAKLDDLVARHATTIQKSMLGMRTGNPIPTSSQDQSLETVNGVFRRSAPDSEPPSPTSLPGFEGQPKTLREARQRAAQRMDLIYRASRGRA